MTSKIRWPLTIYSFSETWIKQTLDSLTLRYVRKWLHFHPGANTSHLRLPLKKIGLASTLLSDLYNKCKLTLRRVLKCSPNADIKRLYNATSYKYVKHDEIVNACAKKEGVKSLCSSEYERRKNEEIWVNLLNLSEENVIIKHILEVSRAKYIKLWQKMIDKLPKTSTHSDGELSFSALLIIQISSDGNKEPILTAICVERNRPSSTMSCHSVRLL